MFMTANEIMRNIRNIFKLSFKEAVIHEILRVNKVVSSTCPTWILIIAESQRLTELIQSIKNRMMKNFEALCYVKIPTCTSNGIG